MYLVINNFILPNSLRLVNGRGATLSALSFKKKGEDILNVIDKFIKKNQIKINKIKGIIVMINYSSFTQARIIVTIANIIGLFSNISLSLLIPEEIKDKKWEEIIKVGRKKLKKKMILPVYNKQPNITIARNRQATNK